MVETKVAEELHHMAERIADVLFETTETTLHRVLVLSYLQSIIDDREREISRESIRRSSGGLP